MQRSASIINVRLLAIGFLIWVFSCSLAAAQSVPAQIELNSSMITVEPGVGLGDEAELTDEQNQFPNGSCQNSWENWGNPVYPQSVYLDLGQDYVVTGVHLFNHGGEGDFLVSSGSPGNWSVIVSDPLAGYSGWESHDNLTVTTRYIRCTKTTDGKMAELVLIGYPATQVDEWILTSSQIGSGSVIRTPDMALYPNGTNVTLAASPASGYLFDHWEGDLSGAANPQNLSMTEDKNVVAVFVEAPDPGEAIKLTLTPAMIVDEKTGGYSGTPAGNLVDEQMVAADPRGGTGGAVATSWMPSWHQIDYPWSCYVDLGQSYRITDIYLFDHEWKAGDFSVSHGSPGNWAVLFTDGLNRNNQWFGQTVNITTRYLRFTRHAATSFVDEIVIYGTTGEPDTTPPAAITDLAATPVSAGSVALSWTATGGDGANGIATLHDVRYSTDPIIASNWNNANPVAAEPAPAPAGTPQSMTVFGLNPNTTYYFAIKAFDDSSNPSPLSNVALATTPPDTGPQAKTFGSFMASIYLMDMPAERIDMFRKMRMYLHTPVIAQNASGPGDLAFDPVDAWFVGQSLDDHLQGRVNNGTEVMLVLETVPLYMGIGQHAVAVPPGSDTTDPDSFTTHAEMCFQVAAFSRHRVWWEPTTSHRKSPGTIPRRYSMCSKMPCTRPKWLPGGRM